MADPFFPNEPSDEAAEMADNGSNTIYSPLPWDQFDDDEDDTEDPLGKNGKRKHPSQIFSYRLPGIKMPKQHVRGGGFASTQFRQTPGAKRIQP